MRKIICCGSVAIVAILMAVDVFAAPPRGGRGRPVPARRPAVNRPVHPTPRVAPPVTRPYPYPNRRPVYTVNPHVKPFTPGWYAHHPRAWYATHNYRPWRAATWAGVAGWIGLTSAPILYGYSNDGLEELAINTQDVAEPANPFAVAEEAADLQAENAQWYPLGMYSLIPPGNTDGIAMLQLAVNKDGAIQGTYQDVMTDTVYPLSGSVDKKTQKATWTVDSNKSVVYETGLHNLTEPITALMVSFGDQKRQKWTLNRVEVEEPTVVE